jgi:hypothetical protein
MLREVLAVLAAMGQLLQLVGQVLLMAVVVAVVVLETLWCLVVLEVAVQVDRLVEQQARQI